MMRVLARVRRRLSLVVAMIAYANSFASAPPNDNCSAGSAITSTPYTDVQTTVGAATEAADPAPECGNGSAAMSVWYRFTAPPSGGWLEVDTFGSDYDTILSAWTGVCGQLAAWPGGCNDDFGSSQSELTVTLAGGATVYLMASAYFGDGGSLVVHASFSSGSGDVTGLSLAKGAGGSLSLSWSPSCQGTDTDFEIYEGAIGSWTSYTPTACTTAGTVSTIVTPSPANAYFLVVPRNASAEGSYGQTGTGAERPQSVSGCLLQSLVGCQPSCAHGKCVVGTELAPNCDGCVAEVCGVDPYCCAFGWDGTCVSEVRSACSSLACPDSRGTCAHGLCVIGAGLTAQCDDPPVDPSCVTAICNTDSFCCSYSWDAACVQEVASVCGLNCN